MSRDLLTVTPETPVTQAWALLSRHRIHTLPVVSNGQQLVGIVSMHDFFIEHDNEHMRPSPVSDAQHRVIDIMTLQVVTAKPEQGIEELVPLLSDGGLHHLPVIDEERQLVGMITQSDLVAALYHGGLSAA